MQIILQLSILSLITHLAVSTRPTLTSYKLRPGTPFFTSRWKANTSHPTLLTLPKAATEVPRKISSRFEITGCPAAFILAERTRHSRIIHRQTQLIKQSRLPKSASITMTTETKENDQIMSTDNNLQAVDQISSILQSSIQSIETKYEECDVSKEIQDAVHILSHMKNQAISYTIPVKNGKDNKAGTNENVNVIANTNPSENASGSTASASGETLAQTAIDTAKSLNELVERVNHSYKGSRKSSGVAWKALESVASSSLKTSNFSNPSDDDDKAKADASPMSEISCALASLAIGLVLAINPPDASTTKMIASAALPSDRAQISMRGKTWKQEGKGEVPWGENYSKEDLKTQAIVHSMVRAAVLGLLRLAADDSKLDPQSKPSGESKRKISIDVIAKIESGFSIGDLGRKFSPRNEGVVDQELAKAVADVVDSVFGEESTGDDDAMDSFASGDDAEEVARDLVPPTLSLVANTRPWEYVQLVRLVKHAAEMGLWYSAELLADAAIDSVVPSEKEKSMVMATFFPKRAKTEALLTDNDVALPVPEDSIAHLAAGAIIDIAFDYRLYRRADVFASKYYSYGGPERYAEARFLHACDTITKLVKKRQVQVIDKQIDRVDKVVAKVSKDLMLTSSTSSNAENQRPFHGEDIAIETMGEHIREFTLRRLRATNMNAAAARLAKIWGMEYEQDPLLLEAETKKRKLTYLQWDDEGCPGNSSETSNQSARPVPELISDPEDLLNQFTVLENNPERNVGFDCEWHDSINGVAVLQLSTLTDSLLLDIPALTLTKEGCDALRATVGKLFSRATNCRLFGFGCKDDIKRLFISPCATGAVHWFPQNEKRADIQDLRSLIAENSQLGGRGAMHFGLSRACEAFLGKQLDKAEQCSDWLARPLTPEQREYAALDAWSCAAIAAKMAQGLKKVHIPAAKK